MPVSEQTPFNSYTANGVTTVFAYDFKALISTDILVTVDGVTKTLTTEYTISGIGSGSGGNVTFLSPPANGAAVLIQRNMGYTRSTDYQENGDFKAETVDNDFDRIVLLIQQVASRAFNATTSFIYDALGRRITNVGSPVSASDVITKGYADANYGATTATINDGAVTTAKIADGAVSTAKMPNDAVTFAKMQNIASARLLGRSTAGIGDPEEISVGSGLTLSGGQLSVSGFPSGTRMSFQQTAAPTGWTKDTTAALDDSIMRIVTGTASSGGSTAFSTFNGQTTVGATTLSASQSGVPAHTHVQTIVGGGVGGNLGTTETSLTTISASARSTQSSTAASASSSHNHTITTSIKYYDFIIASKD